MNKKPAVRAKNRKGTLYSFAQKCRPVQCARDIKMYYAIALTY